MRNVPEKYLQKIEVIKKAILVRSGLLSEFGKNVKIEISNLDYSVGVKDDLFYELILDVHINDIIDCSDCSHFPEQISEIIDEYVSRVNDAADFGLDNKDLSIRNGHSLRGVLVDSFTYSFSEISGVVLSIFYDPGLD